MDRIRDVEQKLTEWRDAGLVTADQVAQILQREREAVAARPRSSAFAEILGYVGGALALVAALILGSEFWDKWSDLARVAVLAGTTVVVGLAAALVGRAANPAILRLSDFLFVLATISLAFTVGLLSAEVLDWSESTTATLATLAALLVSSTLWWRRRSPIRHVALFASGLGFVLAFGTFFDQMEPEFVGLAIWGIGFAWGMLSWAGLLPPTSIGYTLAAGSLIVGSLAFGGGEDAGLGLLLGLVTAGALVAAGVFLSSTMVLAIGTVGVFIFVPRVIFEWFGGTAGGALALLITGLLLLVAAIVIGRLGRKVIREARLEEKVEAPAKPTMRRTTVAIVAAAIAFAVIAIYVIIAHTPAPDFQSIRGSGVAVPGRVAFMRWDDGNCLMAIAATGDGEREVTCEIDGGTVTWTSDGNLAMLAYGRESGEVVVIDPETGATLFRREAAGLESRLYSGREARIRRADGARVETVEEDGFDIVRIRQTGENPRDLIRVTGPGSYSFWDVQWSPDGAWVLAVDSLNRMIVVAADGSVGPYLLADDVNEPAWYIDGETRYTVEITAEG